MKKQMLSLIFFSLLFSVALVWAEPDPETVVTLTASLDGQSGQVAVPYEILKHSDYMRGMLSNRMSESIQLENQEPINLDLILESVVENLEKLELEFVMTPQEWLDEIVNFLERIGQQEEDSICGFLKDIFLNGDYFDENKVLTLLFSGDVLYIPRLICSASFDLAKNISRLESKKLFGLMHFDKAMFAEFLIQEIIEENCKLVLPIFVNEDCANILRGHTRIVSSARFGPDGRKIVTASSDETAVVWEQDETWGWVCEEALRGHTDSVNSARFSPDGTSIVTASSDNTARVWKYDEDKGWVCVDILKGHRNKVWSASFSPSGNRIVTSGCDYRAIVWEKDCSGKWKDLDYLCGHNYLVYFAEFHKDDNHIFTASSEDNEVRSWEYRNEYNEYCCDRCCRCKDNDFKDGLKLMNQDCQKLLVKTSLCGNVEYANLWMLNRYDCKVCCAKLIGHLNHVGSANLSFDGNWVVTGSFDKTAMVWDLSVLKEKRSLIEILFFVLVSNFSDCFHSLEDREKIKSNYFWKSLPRNAQQSLEYKMRKVDVKERDDYSFS